MMSHGQEAVKNTCNILAVRCRTFYGDKGKGFSEYCGKYPFPELVSSGRLEVQTLIDPSKDEFCKVLESFQPNLVYLQGELLENEEVGSLVWGGVDFSTAEAISELFNAALPTTVYLEIPHGDELAEELHFKMGIPYVIYWKDTFSCYVACHFRQALLSVVQSSSCHTWDAFQLAHASFRLYCVQSNPVLPANDYRSSGTLGPCLLGDPLTFSISPPEIGAEEDEDREDEEGSLDSLPTVKIHDDDVSLRLLICGVPQALDTTLLVSLEDGLNALLSIEMRGSKLHGKFSAPPPPLQAGTFSRGVVTMRCDLSTCSSAHISLLVSGSAQTCFDDQLLENHIKHEITEKNQPVHALLSCEENILPSSEPRKSASIACGATVFEVCLKVPSWASQVLRQLVPEVSYRSLVALGIAGIQGAAVASFEKDDAERMLFFCPKEEKVIFPNDFGPPIWLRPPAPRKRRSKRSQETSSSSHNGLMFSSQADAIRIDKDLEIELMNGVSKPLLMTRQTSNVAALRPIPHIRRYKMPMFSSGSLADGHDGGQIKATLPVITPAKHSVVKSTSATQRKSFTGSYHAKQIVSLNPLPLKKHDCNRGPIHACTEEEFLKDVMDFLLLRGHTRLIPQGGLSEFPEAVLNAKRLDLYNLYKEVVTRGGFHVGNGINWKGQVFSKMRNYTMTNRMTGVGNTLKRHYETYLMEYELAHDDVDGECCLLCRSSAAGDWVNCGMCGEWAHFGCDRRQGLGAFKDYAKTDGLEYICPPCSITNFKRKPKKASNGFSQGLMV